MATFTLGEMEIVTFCLGKTGMATSASQRSGDSQPHVLKVRVAIPYLSKVEVAMPPYLLRWEWRWPYYNMPNTILDYINFYSSTLYSTSTPEEIQEAPEKKINW